MKQNKHKSQAFTVVELLVVIAIVALLVILQLPALANTQGKVQRVYCSGNLKQVGVAFRTWAESRNGRFPMAVPNNQGGAASAVGVARTTLWTSGPPPNAQGVWGMFIVMSNELQTPKILHCPSEGGTSHNGASSILFQATVFGPQTFVSTNVGFQNDFNVSYFVGVDATDTAPNRLLAGDHNLGTGNLQVTKVPQFISAGTNLNWLPTSIGWQDYNHSKQGNVTFADGSVQNLNTVQFRMTLNNTGDTGRSAGNFLLAAGSQGTGVNRLQFP
jgi:prepilin-type processing-associated H-X9-DG protein